MPSANTKEIDEILFFMKDMNKNLSDSDYTFEICNKFLSLKKIQCITNSNLIDFMRLFIDLAYHAISCAKSESTTKLDFYSSFVILSELAQDKLFKEQNKQYLSKINMNDCNENGDNFLIIAAAMGNEKLVKYLLKKKVKINLQNNVGLTPLIIALMSQSSINIIKLLLDHGAYLQIRDLNGMTALDHANNIGNQEIISLLSEKAKREKIENIICFATAVLLISFIIYELVG